MSGEGFLHRATDVAGDALVDGQVDRVVDGFAARLEKDFLPGGSSGVIGQTVDTGLNTFVNSEVNSELNRFI